MDQAVGAAAVIVPIVAIVSIFVLLPWLIFHYNAKKRELSAPPAGDPMMNNKLQAIAERLEKRLQALETILDAEVPGWRKQFDHRRDA